MTSADTIKGLAIINTSNVFIASAGILAKYIGLSSGYMIFARCLIATFILSLFFLINNPSILRFPIRDRKLLVAGLLFFIHWFAFFQSIAYAGVSIAVTAIFTFPIFTAFIEPLLLHTKFRWEDLVICCIMIIGVYCISPEVDLSNSTFMGLVIGLVSSLAYAIRNVMAKSLLKKYSSLHFMYYQILIVGTLSVVFSGDHGIDEFKYNLLPLIALGIFPTILGHSLLVESFKYFSVLQASILTSIQPVLAIALAILFFKESPNTEFYLGATIIFVAVMAEVLIKNRNKVNN